MRRARKAARLIGSVDCRVSARLAPLPWRRGTLKASPTLRMAEKLAVAILSSTSATLVRSRSPPSLAERSPSGLPLRRILQAADKCAAYHSASASADIAAAPGAAKLHEQTTALAAQLAQTPLLCVDLQEAASSK